MLGVQVPPGLPVFLFIKGLLKMEKIKLVMQKIMQFLSDAKSELKKVTWPSRKQAMASTLIVIIIVFVMAIYFGIIDFGLAKLIKFILG
jgi:preprotein translocase subunit SecE